MPRQLTVYILTNHSQCYYVGVTNNLHRRWTQHRTGVGSKHCKKFRITRLVFAEVHGTPMAAIRREKQVKRWSRAMKRELIASMNPGGVDLAVQWGWKVRPESSVVLGARFVPKVEVG
ncbi:MAG: GIY-YIG nuclease family protein [Gemmatimonadota bacterium]